ncbi:hypothetical protein GCM10029964_104730 [Kibdelosporangium lantanae]
MTIRAWYTRALHSGLSSLLLLVALTIRLAGVVSVAVALPFVWERFTVHWLALATVGGMALSTGAVVLIWLRTRTIGLAGLLVDVPTGLALLLVNASIAPDHPGWGFFAYPHTVLVSLTLGMATRSATVAGLLALTWGGGYVLADVLFHHGTVAGAVGAIPSYAANTLAGWAVARARRRADADLVESQRRELEAATELATQRERHRQARALHDRVLQTLETLANGDLVDDPGQRAVVRNRAAWLRRFVETGATRASALEQAAVDARSAGLAVDFYDTGLRTAPDLPSREILATLADVTRALLLSLASHNNAVVVRVDIERSGVLLTVLVTRGTTPPDAGTVAVAKNTLGRVGGEVRVEPDPFVELWVPL